MKVHPALALGVTLLASTLPALAVDHDNVDAGRPLDFDDAETIAFREKAAEFGVALVKPRTGETGVAGEAEFLLGFAKNWHLNVGIDPQFVSNSGGVRRFSAGNTSVGVQHNFNRETSTSPALGFRADATLPTGRNSKGVDFRLRGIASRKFGRYGRLHLNADLTLNNSPNAGQRKTILGVIIGYSQPLGFPTRFDRTVVAQIGFSAAPTEGTSALVNVGVGLRQQVSPRSVFDVGVRSDIAGGGSNMEQFRLVAGYSTAF